MAARPLGGGLLQHLAPAVGEIGVGPPGAAADAAPDLVELGQPHLVRVLDDERVHVGDVDAGLDDGGADQDVRLPVHHGLHDGGQLLLRHLPVAGDDTDLRPQHLLEPGGGGVDALHPVVEVVYLAAPAQLPADGILNDGPVVLQHIGLHRLPVRRGLLQGGHVPQARKCHVQRPGDRSGGEGQHVHLAAHLLQPLLVGDAEPLFLVDHQQAQVFERHVFLKQLVRADQQVHAAVFGGLQDPLLLLGGGEAGQHLDLHRKVPEPADSGGVMLLGQDGGGHQDGGLLPVQDALHHRPECHLRLAVAHVAA